jgi:hypothetical protein
MTALEQVRALRARPWWVPTLLLVLVIVILALQVAQCAALIVLDVVERVCVLARTAIPLLMAPGTGP